MESEMGEVTISEGLQHRLALTGGMMKIFAASPAVRGGYLSFSMALASGVLDAKFREQIALAVAGANHSEASVALHHDIAKRMGMSEDEIRASQRCHSDDAKRTAAMKFACELVASRGQVSPEAVLRIRNAGYGDAAIAEIAANAWVVTLANCLECLAASQAEPNGAPVLGLFSA